MEKIHQFNPAYVDFARMLRQAGMRLTAPRLAVLNALKSHPHSQTDDVIKFVRKNLGSVSQQAIYNVLGDLVKVGLIRRIEPAGSNPLYELRVGDNHHHAVCRLCALVVDIDCVVGKRPCLEPIDTAGFDLDEAEVTFWGLCPDCRNSSNQLQERCRISSPAKGVAETVKVSKSTNKKTIKAI